MEPASMLTVVMSASCFGDAWTESGRGVDDGERGWSDTIDVTEGDDFRDGSGEGALDASPIANVAARSLSSKVDLVLPSLGGVELAFRGIDPMLPERWVARDFRRLLRADSANWLEDIGEEGRNDESSELEREADSRCVSAGAPSEDWRGTAGVRFSTAWRNWENMKFNWQL